MRLKSGNCLTSGWKNHSRCRSRRRSARFCTFLYRGLGMASLLESAAEEALKPLNATPLKGKTVLLTGATGLIGVNIRTALGLLGVGSRAPSRSVPDGTFDYIVHAAGYAQPAKRSEEHTSE